MITYLAVTLDVKN